ncbi:MAG: ATP-dependent 6-phosphofructokinase [Syntrophobacteraceae bacterium]|jgi:6-phosphofructokinase 1|nr:ATP-dependent 6-phosphofructokinase [Syntrophobacteraceae bacterium]
MQIPELDFSISTLGECRIPSPMTNGHTISDRDHVLYHNHLEKIEEHLRAGQSPPFFEKAGPREKIYFDPSKLKCGIVTCGGLCPGLNDVIRAIVMSLYHHYGVRTIFGFRYGYEGLSPRHGHTPVELTPGLVAGIHDQGGTILGSSRGPQEVPEMVDTLERMNVGILFAIGGDGTLRGAQAISEEIGKRGLKIAVIGVPKTIDNDISCLQRSFGFETAVTEAGTAITSAHTEALGARNGVGLVKLMGRESGFIAAYAALAYNDVNFCLVPEIPFTLEGFLDALEKRLERKGHAVIVVGEGAGQDLMQGTQERDASGNVRFGDIGVFLRDRIIAHYRGLGKDMTLKYIDPSYIIRSVPANAHDSAFCLLLGHNAVHAGMSGRTNMVVGDWGGEFTHVPIPMAVSRRKKIDPGGRLWSIVLASTGQPAVM